MTEATEKLRPIEERPLVTFALIAYNQEKYIREAVQGAFAQSYEPLEIILSDDCSTDKTFEIMCEMLSQYKGRHKIILNKNQINLGLSAHVRNVHEMSNGEIIVHAAGDDVSYSFRTEVIVKTFYSSNPKPSIIVSNAKTINEKSEQIGYLIDQKLLRFYERKDNPFDQTLPISGCSVAIHRSVVEKFPKPSQKMISEDQALNFRSHLLDGGLYISDVLLNYRISSDGIYGSGLLSSSTGVDIIKHQTKWTMDYIERMNQILVDIKISERCEELKKIISNQAEENKLYAEKKLKMLQSDFLVSLGTFIYTFFLGSKNMKSRSLLARVFLIRWVPQSVNFKRWAINRINSLTYNYLK